VAQLADVHSEKYLTIDDQINSVLEKHKEQEALLDRKILKQQS
jgi:hypothetical protein